MMAAANRTVSDVAGNGGSSESGTAVGGDAGRTRTVPSPPSVMARATADDTAGGNAFSGETSDVNGGYVVNDAGRGKTVNGDKSEFSATPSSCVC